MSMDTQRVRRLLARLGGSLRFLPLLVLVASAQAQTGTLTGVVVDETTGETLIGVNVAAFPAGSDAMAGGSATDLDGRYRIQNLAAGSYDLVVSYVGFNTKRVTGLDLAAGATVTLDIPLQDEAIQVGEAVVEARAIRDSGAALLRERQRAAGVSDAIAADDIARSGASDASDAMAKVTGASVVGGRYVVMRGLQGRYLNVQLNGATLPSADPDRNAVPLDLFPSGLLDNIVTSKTFTPDRPGDFTGGSVNLATRDFPERLTGSVSVSSGFNANVAPGTEALYVDGGAIGLLGRPETDLDLPAEADGEIPDIAFARGDDALADRLSAVSEAFSPVMAPAFRAAPLNRSVSVSLGNEVRLLGRPLGFITGVNWSQSYGGFSNGVIQAFRGEGTDTEITQLGLDYGASPDIDGVSGVQVGTEDYVLGGLANLSYRVTDRSEIGLNLIYNKNARTEALYRTGRFFDGNLNQDAVLESRSLLFVDRTLAQAQLRGEHALTQGGLRVEWNASAAHTTQDEPDYRIFENDYIDVAGERQYSITPSVYASPTRYFRDLAENAYTANLDVTIPVALFQGTRFKTGGTVLARDRAFREREFQFLSDLNNGAFGYTGDPVAFFEPEHVGQTGETTTGRNLFGNYIADATDPLADYDGTTTTGAGYLMADLGLTDRLRLITGARVEANRTEVTPVNANRPDLVGSLDNVDVLPSANLVYAVTPQLNLRAAYGRTVARPSFRELAPYASYELRNNRTFVGNPDLMRSLIHNLDARVEWFTGPGEILAVSAFYKGFANPIELTYNVNAAKPEIQPRNLSDASVFGLEFEARQRLGMLPGALGNLSVGGNLTLTRSEVTIREEERPLRLDPAQATRPLQGQSPYIVNLDLGYASEATGTSLNVFYNLFGQRLDAVSISKSPDVYEDTRGELDVTASQALGRGFTLRASVKNLLGADYRLIQSFRDVDYVTESYARGRSFSLGIGYRF